MASSDSTRAPARVSSLALSTIFAFGVVGLPLYAVTAIVTVYLPRYYAALGAFMAVVGGSIALVRLIDVALDPVLALFMDRTRTPIGRYRPWLIAGTPILMFGLYKLLIPIGMAPGAVGTGYLILWFLVVCVGFSMINLAAAAWGALLTTDYDARSRFYGWLYAVALAGTSLLLLLPVFTHGAIVPGKVSSMPQIAWILIIAFPIAVALCSVATREPKAYGPTRQNFTIADYRGAIARPTILRIMLADVCLTLGPATTAPIYIYFFKDAKGFNLAEAGFLLIFYGLAGVVGSPFWGKVAQRFGKHRTIQIACVCYGLSQAVLMALPRVWPHHTLAQSIPSAMGMFAVGFCVSAFLMLVRAMVADVVDEVKLEQAKDLTGLLYSMVTTTQKIAAAVSVSVLFPILGLFHYDGREDAVNTPHAIFGLEMCYLFAPIIFVGIGGLAMWGYRLDAARHAEIRAALDARDAIGPEAEMLDELTAPGLASTIAEAS